MKKKSRPFPLDTFFSDYLISEISESVSYDFPTDEKEHEPEVRRRLKKMADMLIRMTEGGH